MIASGDGSAARSSGIRESYVYELMATGWDEPSSAYLTVGSCFERQTRIPTVGAVPGNLTGLFTAAT